MMRAASACSVLARRARRCSSPVSCSLRTMRCASVSLAESSASVTTHSPSSSFFSRVAVARARSDFSCATLNIVCASASTASAFARSAS
eukprot:3103692-Pyramimonas_sp.AAC.1